MNLQVVLITLIVLVMPRSAPKIFGGSQVQLLVEEAEGKKTGISASQGTEYYSVVFDAGSTGELCGSEH